MGYEVQALMPPLAARGANKVLLQGANIGGKIFQSVGWASQPVKVSVWPAKMFILFLAQLLDTETVSRRCWTAGLFTGLPGLLVNASINRVCLRASSLLIAYFTKDCACDCEPAILQLPVNTVYEL